MFSVFISLLNISIRENNPNLVNPKKENNKKMKVRYLIKTFFVGRKLCYLKIGVRFRIFACLVTVSYADI